MVGQFYSPLATPSNKQAGWLHILKIDIVDGLDYINFIMSCTSSYAYRFPSSFIVLYNGFLPSTTYGKFTKLTNIAGTASEQITQLRISRYESEGAYYVDAYISGSNLRGEGYRLYTLILGAYVDYKKVREHVFACSGSTQASTPSQTYSTLSLS